MSGPQRRRRIDRVSAADFLEGVDALPAAELRDLRDDCRDEEARLSYARRLLQGQLDIVQAEQRRRAGEEPEEGLVGSLSEILADDEDARRPRTQIRPAPLFTPDEGGYGARAHDTLVEDPALGRLPDLDDDEVTALAERLAAREVEVSDLRRRVLAHLDALQAVLVRRYAEGGFDVDEVVASATSPESEGS
ncbi:MAG: aerial mycelium formation protein [Egibacteraceae bacterium]